MYLYLKDHEEFYKNPKHFESGYYDNDIIYAEDVTLLRDGLGNAVPEKIFSLITSYAVNVKALKAKGNYDKTKASKEMRTRIENVFEIAVRREAKVLVLGAFGCGVFKNNPYDVKNIFKSVMSSPRYKDKIEKIIFSIYDEKLLRVFKA